MKTDDALMLAAIAAAAALAVAYFTTKKMSSANAQTLPIVPTQRLGYDYYRDYSEL